MPTHKKPGAWKHKNFYLEEEMMETIQRLAQKMDTSGTGVVRLALRQFFRQKKQRTLLGTAAPSVTHRE